MAHPSLPAPTGTVQIRIDDLPSWTIDIGRIDQGAHIDDRKGLGRHRSLARKNAV